MITRRTTRRHFLLRPDADGTIQQLYWYTTAVLAKKFGIKIHAVQMLSTHLHEVLTDVRGELPRFLQRRNRLLALALKCQHKWPEEVFAVCSPEYYRKHGPFETVADLNRASLIQFDDRSKPSMDWNEWFRLQHGAYKSTDSGLRYSDYSLALDASMKGEGVVMGWAPIIDDLITDKRFVLAFPTSSPGGRKYYLIARKGTFASGPNAVFLRWLQRKAVTP